MVFYRKDSLETLRQRIDLADLLSSHLELKRAGGVYKALCPFHDEKTPSFVIQNGDTHYHCFGCGAHGDAITFLMTHLKLNFIEAIELLAERYNVHLERVEGANEEKGVNKSILKDALETACRLFHFLLLHTSEGHHALNYLYQRGIDLDFIKHFKLGLAPKQNGVLKDVLLDKGFSLETMVEAGLLTLKENGIYRDFFYDRITIPICHQQGYVIGFSARKYHEETFGGKYINTSETSLFKKSRVLFGLHASRRRIAKERRAIIVEGQLDALRLLSHGFNITVASQGTAFGESHAAELIQLGVKEVFLAFDADNAGCEAAVKVGNLFQKAGIEVFVIKIPLGYDPDSFLRHFGAEAFLMLMNEAVDYLTFLVSWRTLSHSIHSPAGKSALVQEIVKQVREWDNSLMVHESLRKLAKLTHIPEKEIGVGEMTLPNVLIRQSASIGLQTVDSDKIFETDFLRWLIVYDAQGKEFSHLAAINVSLEDLKTPSCKKLYHAYLENIRKGLPVDCMSLAISIDDSEGQAVLNDLMHKKINREKASEQFKITVKKLLDRNWIQAREEIKMKMHSGVLNDNEVWECAKQFDILKRSPPLFKTA